MMEKILMMKDEYNSLQSSGSVTAGQKQRYSVFISQNLATDLTWEGNREGGIRDNSQVSGKSYSASSTSPNMLSPSLFSAHQRNRVQATQQIEYCSINAIFCTVKPGDKNLSACYIRSDKCHEIRLLQPQGFQFVPGQALTLVHTLKYYWGGKTFPLVNSLDYVLR